MRFNKDSTRLSGYPTKRQINLVNAISATLGLPMPRIYNSGVYGCYIRYHLKTFQRIQRLTRLGILGGDTRC